MKTAPYLIIFALLAWIVLRECGSKPEPLPPSIQANKDSILVKKDRVAALDKAGQAIVQKMTQDSIRHFEALKRSESRVDGLTKSLAAAVRRRPDVIRDTIFILQDSIIREKDSKIAILQSDRDTLCINYTRLLRIKESELRIKDEMFAHMEAINQELFKSLNKERRKGKVWKVAVPVALIAGFIIGEEL